MTKIEEEQEAEKGYSTHTKRNEANRSMMLFGMT